MEDKNPQNADNQSFLGATIRAYRNPLLELSDINHKELSGINQFKLKATNTPGA